HVERREPREKGFGPAALNAQAGRACDAPRQRNRPGTRLCQFLADIQTALHLVLSSRSAVRHAIGPMLTRLRQRGDVAAVGFGPPGPMAVHRAVVRIGHDHVMSDLLEVLRDPLTLRGRLHQHAHARPTPKYVGQSFARRGDPLIDHLAALRHDANLTFFLVEVDGTILHGWSPLLRLERVFAMWSGSYHATKEASRFILSSAYATTPRSSSSRTSVL